MSQKQIIIKYLQELRQADPFGGWVKEYSLRSKETSFGWIGFQGDRRVRELYKAGLLERRKEGKYAEFRCRSKEELVPKIVRQPVQMSLK